jgi:hypothetical protein
VGGEGFVAATKAKHGVRAKNREVVGGDGGYELREAPAAYKGILGCEKNAVRLENTHF